MLYGVNRVKSFMNFCDLHYVQILLLVKEMPFSSAYFSYTIDKSALDLNSV